MAELFKFRCYQCSKLLGAPPSRYGARIRCPRCSAELVVPTPGQEEPVGSEEPPADAVSFEELGLRFDTEPLSGPATVPPTVAPRLAPEPPGPDPVAFLESVAFADPEAPSSTEIPSPSSAENPGVEPENFPETHDPLAQPLLPGARRLPQADAFPRRRDVILPRTAAVVWALFALGGLAMAFTSGLLVGHFLWK
jgi:DNA-directed RNA polymerase subunit RPC12/RpoP